MAPGYYGAPMNQGQYPGQYPMSPAMYPGQYAVAPPMYPMGYPQAPAMFPYGPHQAVAAAPYQAGVQPATYRPENGPAASPDAVSPSTKQLLLVLRDAMYPSQREYAAEALAGGADKARPDVVQALITSASQDSAASVRASAIRCLARLKVNEPAYLDALNRLRGDSDPRVRLEVEQARRALGQVKDTK
jgi:hypothetical protein